MKWFVIFFVLFVSLLSCSVKKNNTNNGELEKIEPDKQTTERPMISINATSLKGNYADGNGTILYSENFGDGYWILRKHIQRIQFPVWHDSFKELEIYEEPISEKVNIIATIKNETINVTQIAELKADDDYYYWLKILTDTHINGWIFCGKHQNKYVWGEKYVFRVPYLNNRWEILETINSNGRDWTIRKMDQGVCVWFEENIYNKPGVVEENIISQIIPTEENSQIYLTVSAITEEVETINGKTDRWLKISYDGLDGWIFGGSTTVERGGPKYYTPENLVYLAIVEMTGSH
jgi:hypothetical protein